jgi:hypothetical protein
MISPKQSEQRIRFCEFELYPLDFLKMSLLHAATAQKQREKKSWQL